MLRKTWTMRVALVWLALAGVASAQEVQTTERAIPGQYIVVLNDDDQAVSLRAAAPPYGHW